MSITRCKATDADKAFARDAHHKGYRDVVARQFGAWDEGLQDELFEKGWSEAEHDILLSDGVPCGYVSTDEFPEYSHVRELVILPTYQGRGIGTTFLKQVIEEAQARHVPVKLGVLRESLARRLYERLGFCESDRTETHVLMERDDNQRMQRTTGR